MSQGCSRPYARGGIGREVIASVVTASNLFSLDVSEFRWVSLHITAQGTASAVNFEGSNDNVNWLAVSLYPINAGVSSVAQSSAGAVQMFVGPLHFRYFRARVSGISAGTTTVYAEFYYESGSMEVIGTRATGGSAAGAADSQNPVRIAGTARTANPTAVTDGQTSNLLTDKLGRVVVVNSHVRDLTTQAQTTITNSTAETTILAAGAAGVLHDLVELVISNAGAAAVTVTIKDATTGTTRLVVDLGPIGQASLVVISPHRTIPQAVAANNWTATLSVNTVTVNFFVLAVKNI